MKNIFFGIVFLVSSPLAYAHSGYTSSLFEAAMHPILGWDHLLAMFMVGIVAYHRMQKNEVAHQSRAKSALTFPLSFMSAMTVGLIVALNSTVSSFFFENVVLLSLFVMGLMVVKQDLLRDLFVKVSLVLIFGFAHGVVHGAELQGDASPLALGMLIGTGLLHGAGFLFAFRLAYRPWACKSAGVVGIIASGFSVVGAFS